MLQHSALVSEARELARRAHQHQKRKASGVAYFTHLQGVAQILERHGYADDVSLAAAYLHDLLEDQPAAGDAMRASMPPAVVRVVEALTEQKLDEHGRKRDKADRFKEYVTGLKSGSEVARRAIPISCADRIHNTLSIVSDARQGFSPFMQLTTRPGELRNQLSELREVYQPQVSGELLATFDRASVELDTTIDRWLPGRAALIAAEAHLGQFDKGGHPYILHPMRLALLAADDEQRIVALLHDVIEDSAITLETLRREGFGPNTLRALDHLTRRESETYPAFIERVARHRLATRVKLLDLEDNSDLGRLASVGDEDRQRRARYLSAIQRLEQELLKRSLYVVLDAESRQKLKSAASLPVFRAEHVTLAYRADPNDFQPSWVPGGHAVGSELELHAIELYQSSDIEALVVQIAGQTERPQDGKTLHLTLSRSSGARSRDANRLLSTARGAPVSYKLRGRVRWVDE